MVMEDDKTCFERLDVKKKIDISAQYWTQKNISSWKRESTYNVLAITVITVMTSLPPDVTRDISLSTVYLRESKKDHLISTFDGM